jgi:Fe-S cluster biogenesis protein NfuA
MTDYDPEISEVIGAMNELVARDGGRITVGGYEPATAQLELDYVTGKNAECETCLITPETLRDFVLEGLRSRGVDVADVVVQAS